MGAPFSLSQITRLLTEIVGRPSRLQLLPLGVPDYVHNALDDCVKPLQKGRIVLLPIDHKLSNIFDLGIIKDAIGMIS
jgi:hypothetical protein